MKRGRIEGHTQEMHRQATECSAGPRLAAKPRLWMTKGGSHCSATQMTSTSNVTPTRALSEELCTNNFHQQVEAVAMDPDGQQRKPSIILVA